MDAYHVALFLHLLTIIVAAGVTTITKLAVNRRIRARTVAEALEWHALLVSASRFFPICLASFLATGTYMVTVLGSRAWSSGYVIAGLVGVTLLLGSGTFLGVKANALKQVLQRIAETGPDAAPPTLVPPRLVTTLPLVNTGIALATVFDMTIKPANVLVALAVIALGIVITAILALSQHGKRDRRRGASPTTLPPGTPAPDRPAAHVETAGNTRAQPSPESAGQHRHRSARPLARSERATS